MRFANTGGKKEHVVVSILNNESSVTIKAGGPVFVDPSGVGLKVLSAESLADAKQVFFFGLSTLDVAPGYKGEAIAYGFFETARVLLRSRAASTNDWPAIDAVDPGTPMDIVTDVGVQALTPQAIPAQTNGSPFAVLCSAIASAVSVASTASDTRIYSTTTYKVQVRAL